MTKKIISETRQAFWILFAEIEQGIRRDELLHIWYITMTSYQFLWRHSYFLTFFDSQPRVFIGSRETCHVYAESPRAGSDHLRFWKFFLEKKVDVIISPLMEIAYTIISETSLFHSLQFSSKLPETWHIYVKIPCADSNHLRFWKFLLEKKLWRQNISTNGNRLKNISETRQAFWILFAGIEQDISRDELLHIWYITMTSY